MSTYQHCQVIPFTRLTLKDLHALGRERQWSISQVEARAIQAHFKKLKREPTDVEMETLAQTWSEHCKHKTLTSPITYKERDADGRTRMHKFKNLLKETIFEATRVVNAPHCLSVFDDNAGVVALNQKWAVAFKVETHNHPTAVEPYGGAATGVGGVVRDILGVGRGAMPIANTNTFCVGPLEHAAELPPGLFHPRRTLRQVVAGVRDYGNRMGIPTVAGGLHFHHGFLYNPLVFAGTVGIMPRTAIQKSVAAGDLIIVLGGKTGRDGIHGATFSSAAIDDATTTSAVQVGSPIEEKKLMDVLLQARDQKLFRAVTDCGAGGFSSAVGELGAAVGAEVHLERTPLKHEGMAPWEIWVSESQERMVLAVPPKLWPALKALCDSEDVLAFELGTFKDTGRLQIFFKGERVADLTMSFLHDGLPRAMQRAEWNAPKPPPGRVLRRGSGPLNWPDAGRRLRDLLAHPNTCSRAWMIRQYDHEVQGQTVQKPLQGVGQGPGDAVVVWPVTATGGDKTVPALAIAHGLTVGNPDPYAGAVEAIDEALRNLACAGVDTRKASMLDNFCWGDVRNPAELGSLTRCAMGCLDAATAYGVPFISGKDSLHNTYVDLDGRRHSIPGTLLISAMAPVDVEKRLSLDLKAPGHPVFLLAPKKPGLQASRAVFDALYMAMEAGHILACHDVSEGGMAVTAAEMAFAGAVGLELTTGSEDDGEELPFFEEGLTRFVVEVEPGREKKLLALFKEQVCWQVGNTVKEPVMRVVDKSGRSVMEEPLEALSGAWGGTLPRVLDRGEQPRGSGSRGAVAAVAPREMMA